MWKSIPRQPRENTSCEKSIKQNASAAVKHALLLLVLSGASLGWSGLSLADETPPPPPAPSEDALPDIQATLRHLKVIKASTSRRVYLMDLPADPSPDAQTPDGSEKPPEKKILLVRNGDENLMALRVLRDISGTNQVIAKKIKQYGDHDALDIGQEYYALEKLSDVIPPPPTPEDKADMQEVEPAPLAFDPDLDTGSSPTPDSDDDGALPKGEERLGASIEEKIVPFEPHRHWIAAIFGLVRNTPEADPLSANYYAAGGIRYGYDIGRRIFVTKDERLDTFTVEGSLFYYSISGLDATSTALDSYTLAPIAATGRYTYYYNEDFGVFLYGGLMKNIVMSAQNSNEDRVANLSRVAPAMGVGALLRVGPQWYTRIDVGLDMIGANLMIRF